MYPLHLLYSCASFLHHNFPIWHNHDSFDAERKFSLFFRLRIREQRTLANLHLTLLSVALLDELVTGLPIVGLPLVRTQFNLNYTQVGLLFTVGAFVTMLLDPFINLLSDRSSKRYWILGGLCITVIGFALSANASNFVVLLLAFTLIAPASSTAIELSQAALVDQQPGESTRAMTRWTLMSSIGDLLAPLTITLIAGLHSGWPQICWLAALLWFNPLLALSIQRFPASTTQRETEDERESSMLTELRLALHTPGLLRWAMLSIIPSMVDEVFLGFATLYLHDQLHVNQVTIGLIVALLMFCSLLSLYLMERLLFKRYSPHHLLLWLSALTLVGMIAFLTTHVLWLAIIALCMIGVGAVSWYPLAKGQAYALYPERSGTVLAVISLFNPIETALPGIIGLIATHFGLITGLAALGTAPLWMMFLLFGYKK